MVYKVVVTKDAEEDLDSFIRYLLVLCQDLVQVKMRFSSS